MAKQQRDSGLERKVLLTVGAHPDDIDFSASATVAKMVSEGWEAYYVVCTDGSRGSSDPAMTHERLAEIREREQRAAAKILGVKDVFFLKHPDTQLTADQELKEELVRLIRTIRPTIVITIDPTFYFSLEPSWGHEYHFINHTDHRAAGLATMDAVFPLARDRLTFPLHEKEGLKPHRVEELWLVHWGRKEADFLVDVSQTLSKKLEAIAAHESQYDDFPTIEKRMTTRAQKYAEKERFDYAESFIRLLMP